MTVYGCIVGLEKTYYFIVFSQNFSQFCSFLCFGQVK